MSFFYLHGVSLSFLEIPRISYSFLLFPVIFLPFPEVLVFWIFLGYSLRLFGSFLLHSSVRIVSWCFPKVFLDLPGVSWSFWNDVPGDSLELPVVTGVIKY